MGNKTSKIVKSKIDLNFHKSLKNIKITEITESTTQYNLNHPPLVSIRLKLDQQPGINYKDIEKHKDLGLVLLAVESNK